MIFCTAHDEVAMLPGVIW